ncbi:MAG: sulfotransferase family protein [Nocardioides sp.]
MTGVLVLVTGTGRSGTSTIAGSLHHLGLHVPGPYLGANESNPKGFFESTWAVKFHKRITAAAGIHDFDSRPGALDRARESVTPRMKASLVEFLRRHSVAGPQLVVKDPRSVWVQQLWKDAAREAELEIRFLSMLRHPAEVVGSRTTYYASKSDEDQRRRYETFNIARWVNNSLISERETRGEVRTFVPYSDLLDDWRPVLARVADELGLTFDSDLTAGSHHPVDDFIDPGLRRHTVSWDDIEVPDALREVAQEVWDVQMVLCGHAGADAAASERLDAAAERYEQILAEAAAVSHDMTGEIRDEARRAGAREAREQAGKAGGRQGSPSGSGPGSGSDRALRDVNGRELVREVGKRAARRLRRPSPREHGEGT